jgi:two-component system phosphate regulon sensor histidine kinase PhoR
LIGDLLELSKIESRLVPLRLAPVDLHELIGKTMEAMGNQAANKHIALSMAVDRDLYIEADEDRLRQILINLLSNGISYTPEGGRVCVKAFPVGDGPEEEKVQIVVSDTGIGIPKEDLTRIFERFYKVDKARSRSSGGTGLGLSIVKHLVDLHGGTIHVDSVVGVETSFTIELPILQK